MTRAVWPAAALLVLVATACGGSPAGERQSSAPVSSPAAAQPTVAQPVATAVPAVVATTAPPVPGTPAAPPASSPVQVTLPGGLVLSGDGRTGPGPYFRGRLEAPVTVEEYGDFQ